ncbi:unnamed protein product [Arabidopsis lyrata]|uniref:Uncharacterized protein n=1 Tax=Arabidopsis lyrata subsp. lyrata TaxID=81972 RepID=D7LGT0_ARALL|nr:hypothetical protein ARALYDRAFT_900918 [Arabidopsis lyrata subsp. lyrata]CAH8263315.1 unnamed protein product [Arabidopsis lyrata]
MFTVAMRSITSLVYLEKVREYMVQATDKNLEDENADTLTNKKHVTLLAEEDCTVPYTFGSDIQNVAGFVCPETSRWLEELERQDGFKLQDNQLDCVKLGHNHKEHLVHDLRASFGCIYCRL